MPIFKIIQNCFQVDLKAAPKHYNNNAGFTPLLFILCKAFKGDLTVSADTNILFTSALRW